jgi:uncharacterized SAM-binding protein YcdF (DUF218 family)
MMLRALRTLLAIGTCILLALALSASLAVNESPAPADVVVVLAGNPGVRLPRALQLVSASYASRLLVSNDRERAYALAANTADLPAEAILVLDQPATSTRDEARGAAEFMQAHGLRSALLVTDAYHSRRASLLFNAEFGRHGLTVRSTPAGDGTIGQWWTNPPLAETILLECVKLTISLIQGAYW